EAVSLLLAPAFEEERARAAVVEGVLANMAMYSAEIRPGVLLLHAHMPQDERHMLFVGTSTAGLQAADVSSPVHVIVVLLDPAERDAAQHVRALASVARLVRSDGVVERLRTASSPAELQQVLETVPA